MFCMWASYCFLLLIDNFVLLFNYSAFPSPGMFIIRTSSPRFSFSLLAKVCIVFGTYCLSSYMPMLLLGCWCIMLLFTAIE